MCAPDIRSTMCTDALEVPLFDTSADEATDADGDAAAEATTAGDES